MESLLRDVLLFVGGLVIGVAIGVLLIYTLNLLNILAC